MKPVDKVIIFNIAKINFDRSKPTCIGIYLSLRGVRYTNNSLIPITEVGTEPNNPTNEAVQCITDLRPCCRQSGSGLHQQNLMLMGQWYYPNKTLVPDNVGNDSAIFQTRGLNDGTISLFRASAEIISPTGSYCCEIPDTTRTNRTVCIVTGEILHIFDS